MSFAENTTVSVEKSRAEIEALLTRHGADQFISGWDSVAARIGFRSNGRMVKFEIPFPDRSDKKFTALRRKGVLIGVRTAQAAQEHYDQELRRRYRALALVIKAKLEAVATGITTFEEEFLAHIVLPDGATVGQWAGPQLERAYSEKKMPPLMIGIGARQ